MLRQEGLGGAMGAMVTALDLRKPLADLVVGLTRLESDVPLGHMHDSRPQRCTIAGGLPYRRQAP